MITIQIGNDSRPLEDAEESWIARQVNKRQKDGLPVCVQITIKAPGFDMILTTPACGGGGGGGGRHPNRDEAAILELWRKHKLNTESFSGGNVLAFVKQLRHHL